jgi:hypothetical protein
LSLTKIIFLAVQHDVTPPQPPEQNPHPPTRRELTENQRKEVYSTFPELIVNGRLPNGVFGLVTVEFNRSSIWRLWDQASARRKP